MSCKKCGGTGWIIVTQENGYEVAKPCDCGYLEQLKSEKQHKFSNIPETYKDVRLGTHFYTSPYKDKETITKAVDIIKYWRDNLEQMIRDGIGLYIYSEAKGSGKTLLAAGIANELLYEHNLPVKFASATQIIQEIKATWDKDNASTESRLINQLCTIRILVIDDLGTELYVDWIAERMYHIVNERYVRKLATIYTSNSACDKLIYDDRIKNRILERSVMVRFPEESIREQIAIQRQAEIEKAIQQKNIEREETTNGKRRDKERQN